MAGVARYALDHGCHRIDWHVKASNGRGIRFYESLGAGVTARLSYRRTEPAVSTLAGERVGSRLPYESRESWINSSRNGCNCQWL